MTIFTPAANILVANHKAHRVLVKLHVLQIPKDQSSLVKIGQQWPCHVMTKTWVYCGSHEILHSSPESSCSDVLRLARTGDVSV